MIGSVHLADVGVGNALAALRTTLRPGSRPGLRYGALMLAAPLSGSLLPRPNPGRIGLLAFWDDDEALDNFLAEDPVATRFAQGWHVRLEPIRHTGDWPGLSEQPAHGHTSGPAVTVTLGRLRLPGAARFLRASARTQAQVLAAPGLLWGTGLSRPPVVATCSLWRSVGDLAAYAHRPGRHADAIAEDRKRPFHHRSIFIRARPRDSVGQLAGRNPLAADWSTAGAEHR